MLRAYLPILGIISMIVGFCYAYNTIYRFANHGIVIMWTIVMVNVVMVWVYLAFHPGNPRR